MPFFQDWGLIPRQLMATPQTPDWMWIAPAVAQTFQFLFGRPGILATLVLTFIYILFIGGVMSVFYAFMYQLAAPSRYGPMDAPPIRTKVKKYKR
jgi:drug/metabolite transporter (DMT)-like permease